MCEYCGTSAGWFSSSHPACVAKVQSTAKTVNAFVVETLLGGGTLADLTLGVQKILSESNVKQQYVNEALLDGLSDGISQFSKKAPISNDDYARMKAIYEAFGYESSLQRPGRMEMELSLTIWQAQNNCLQQWGESLFSLRHGEILCYQAEGVSAILLEEKTVTTGRGYGGFSVPLGHGLYGHLGESRPQKVSGLMPIDAGAFAITTENIYFSGSCATTQIPLQHVVRYQPYVDGIGVSEGNGAPKVFTLFQNCQFPDGRSISNASGYDTGWFLYPLLTALTNRLNGVSNPPTLIQTTEAVAFQNAFETFKSANEVFSDLLCNAVKKQQTIPTENLDTYAKAVNELIATAKALNVSDPAFNKALQTVETNWNAFYCGADGRIQGDACPVFISSVGDFMGIAHQLGYIGGS